MADNFFEDKDVVETDNFFDDEDVMEDYPEELELTSETPEADLGVGSALGKADVIAAEKALETTGAGEAIERSITKAGEAVKDLEPVKKLGKGLEGAAVSGLSKIGVLEPSDIRTVAKNRELYQTIKEQPGKLPKELAELAGTLGDEARTRTKNLDVMMESDDLKMPREKFLEEVKGRVSDSRMEPTKARLKQAKDSEKAVKQAERKVQRFEDTQAKKAQQLQNKLDEKQTLLNEYKQNETKLENAEIMRDNEKQALDRQLDEVKQQKRLKEKEIIEYKKAGGSKEAILEIQDEIKDLDIESDKLTIQKRKLGENLKDLKNKEKLEKVKNKKLVKKYIKEVAEAKDELKILNNKGKSDLKVLQDRLNEAKKKAETFRIKGKGMTEANRKAFESLERVLDYTTEVGGMDLALAKEQADKLFGTEGDDVRKAVRDVIREGSPEARKALDEASSRMGDRKNLLKLLGFDELEIRDLEGKISTQEVLPKGESSKRLAASMFTELGAEGAGVTQKEALEELLKRAGKGEKITDLELNRIARLTEMNKAELLDFLAAAKTRGVAVAPTTRALGTMGAKAQVAGAKALGAVKDVLDTPLGKITTKGARGVGKTLPFIGAGLDLMETEELGIEDPLAKAAYVGAEQLNPLPVSTGDIYRLSREVETSSPEGAVAMEAARKSLPALESLYNVFKGLDEKKQVKEITKLSEDRENVGQLIGEMKQVDEDFANRIQNIQDTSENDTEFKRRMSLLSSDPAYRELVRRRMRRIGNEQSDREQD